MENGSSFKDEEEGPDLYIAAIGEKASVKANGLCAKLSDLGIVSETDLVGRSLKAQMKYANKIDAAFTLILGDGELQTGRAQLRNMKTGDQFDVSPDDIESIIKIVKREGV